MTVLVPVAEVAADMGPDRWSEAPGLVTDTFRVHWRGFLRSSVESL